MSLYDSLLLRIFRASVSRSTGMPAGDLPGMDGLVDQGRSYMLKLNAEDPSTADERQADMVRSVLRSLMGPVVPVYRLFMGGIVPSFVGDLLKNDGLKGRQVFSGGLPYAPYLTSAVTPLFFQFLVGPARPGRRDDGSRGAVVVEKCRFLERSNCKGMCLHICKAPAQEFFGEELGVPLTVKPNFDTHECHWVWGREPEEVEDDEEWPRGCLVGCESRKQVAAMAR